MVSEQDERISIRRIRASEGAAWRDGSVSARGGARIPRLLDDLRHQEVVVFGERRVEHDLAGVAAIRDRVLAWCGAYAPDRDWFIQKAVAWWLRELSKHDAPRARAFLDAHGATLKPFARKEAGKFLA